MSTRIKYMRPWRVPIKYFRLLITLYLLLSSSAWALSPSVEQVRKSILLDVESRGEQMIAVGERGYIITSADRGNSWLVGKTPVVQTLTAVFILDDKRAWAVGHDGIILASADGGLHWSIQRSHRLAAQQNPDQELGFGPLMDIWFEDEKKGFAVGSFGQFLYTEDGGSLWQSISDSLDNIDEYHLNAIIPTRPGQLLIAAEAGLAFISADMGKSWQQRQMPNDVSLFGASYSPATSSLYLFGLQGYLFRSDDQGENWVMLTSGINSPLYKSYLDASGVLYFFGGGVILSTRDQGNTFTRFTFEDRRVITAGTLVSDLFFLVGQAGLQTLEGISLSVSDTQPAVAERENR